MIKVQKKVIMIQKIGLKCKKCEESTKKWLMYKNLRLKF